VIEDYIDPEDVEKAFQDSGLARYAYAHDRNTPFPTLRELIESDRRVLVMAENDNGGGAIPWYHDGRRRRGLLPNLLAVDFYDEGDEFEVARKLNRLSRDAEPQVRETG
jgi:hypothetical protein